MTKLPNFICVGAQKAGTTTLHDILKQHPDIYLPELKEAHFFDQKKRYVKGIKWWLNTFFSKYNNEKIMGVMTPEYLYYEEVPDRVLKDLGSNVKIIIILRNPVERSYSHYLMSVRRGFESMSFMNAIENESMRILQGEFERNNFSYIARGLYSQQVTRYTNRFSKNNILFLSFENSIVNNIDSTITHIENFLDIDKIKLNTTLKSNSASEPRLKFINTLLYKKSIIKKIFRPFFNSLSLKVKIAQFIDSLNQKPTSSKKLSLEDKKDIMDKYFKEDIVKLEGLLGQDLSYWYTEKQ